MKKLLLLMVLLSACASKPELHKDVELGNESNNMMQCKILCDKNKVYNFSQDSLNCQCTPPVNTTQNQVSPVLRFEVVNSSNNEEVTKGVMGQLLNGKVLISNIKGN